MAQKRKQKEEEQNAPNVDLPPVDPSEQFMPVQATDNTSASSGFLRFGSGSIQDIQVILKNTMSHLLINNLKFPKKLYLLLFQNLKKSRKTYPLKLKKLRN